ncbi:MAG TPA: hypothetical protein VFL38_17085, partial [Humibacillus xanthopallidus]|nr:hypothetical protein [Humibacillus xanthopallidus]
ILLVPIAWIHVVRLMSGRVSAGMVGAGLVVAAWWWIAFRTLDQGRTGYVTVVGATFVMVTVSVLRDAWLCRSRGGVQETRERTTVGHPTAVD